MSPRSVIVYGDESGDFEFSDRGSEYFIVGTVTVSSYAVGDALLDLRRRLAWQGIEMRRAFHATDDTNRIRREVFALISQYEFKADFTLLRKRFAEPHVRSSPETFYRYAWYYHMRHLLPRIVAPDDALLVVVSSIGTKRKAASFQRAVQQVLERTVPTARFSAAFWEACTDPCLQVADYCCWAVKRKWENGDPSWYRYISRKVASEFALFREGQRRFY
jgi:hypothetical protein